MQLAARPLSSSRSRVRLPRERGTDRNRDRATASAEEENCSAQEEMTAVRPSVRRLLRDGNPTEINAAAAAAAAAGFRRPYSAAVNNYLI